MRLRGRTANNNGGEENRRGNNNRPPPRNTTVATSLPPTPATANALPAEDENLSSLIRHQNLLMNYHMEQMRRNLETFWRRNFEEEVRKTTEMEEKLREKEEKLAHFRTLCRIYEDKAIRLEDRLAAKKVAAGEGCSGAGGGPAEEDVASSFVDPDTVPWMDMACRNCGLQPANVLWYPCRHLSTCASCESKINGCPICKAPKNLSFMVNLPAK